MNLVSGTGIQLDRLVAHGAMAAFDPFQFDVDVTEYAGAGQLIDQQLPFDTLFVTGSATRQLQTGVTDTIARVVMVHGSMALAGGSGNQMAITDSLVVNAGGVFDHNGANLIVGSSSTLDGGLVTVNGGVFVMKLQGWVTLNGDAHFAGGSTEGLITDGLMYVRGDFYAESGAFQASGNHTTSFEQTPGPITLKMPSAGPGTGADHFNHLHLATQNAIGIESDVYALGDLSDYFDGQSATVLHGAAGVSIVSDGWDLGSGITLNNVTLALDEEVNPGRAGALTLDNAVFADYGLTGATRLRIRHPGIPLTIQFNDVDFASSEADPGVFVHATDSDGATPDALSLLFYYPSYPTVGPPGDFSRVIMENGATYNWNTP